MSTDEKTISLPPYGDELVDRHVRRFPPPTLERLRAQNGRDAESFAKMRAQVEEQQSVRERYTRVGYLIAALEEHDGPAFPEESEQELAELKKEQTGLLLQLRGEPEPVVSIP